MKAATQSELNNLSRTLHDLFQALPAIRQHNGPDAVRRQMKLIAHFQRQYDRLANTLR